MIRLKDIINEGDLALAKIPLARSDRKDPYTVQATTGLKVLGVDPAAVRYEMAFGKTAPKFSTIGTSTKLSSFDKGKLRGKAVGSIWKWDSKILWEIFERARNNYKELVKKHHPDRPGGDEEKMMLINRAWEVVKKVFNKNGYELPE